MLVPLFTAPAAFGVSVVPGMYCIPIYYVCTSTFVVKFYTTNLLPVYESRLPVPLPGTWYQDHRYSTFIPETL